MTWKVLATPEESWKRFVCFCFSHLKMSQNASLRIRTFKKHNFNTTTTSKQNEQFLTNIKYLVSIQLPTVSLEFVLFCFALQFFALFCSSHDANKVAFGYLVF